MTRLLSESAQAVAVMAVLALLVAFLAEAATALRPGPQDDGIRREPPATVGAQVITEHGPGVITAQVRMGDGPAWQVRLVESGKHVVLYRAEMVVLP